MDDLAHASTCWLRDQPALQTFAEYLVERIKAVIRPLGLATSVNARAKEIDSVIKKLILKPMHTYSSLGDKVGARIVVKRLREVNAVAERIQEYFTCGAIENTAD